MVDIDGDGLQDVLFATGRVLESKKNNEENPSMKEYDIYCSKIGIYVINLYSMSETVGTGKNVMKEKLFIVF